MRAQFRGTCSICDDVIRPGDDIRNLEEVGAAGWGHVDCLSIAEAGQRLEARMASRPRCPRCADVLALGRCTNCEG